MNTRAWVELHPAIYYNIYDLGSFLIVPCFVFYMLNLSYVHNNK